MIWSNETLHAEQIKTSFGEYSAITMGEEGRGRKRVILPIKFPITNELLKQEEVSISLNSVGKPVVVKNDTTLSLLVTTGFGYTRRGDGWAEVLTGKDSIKVLAKANGADGDAGRIGCWEHYLISILDKNNVVIAVHKSGQLDSAEIWYLIWIREGFIDYFRKTDLFNFLDIRGLEKPLWVDDEGNLIRGNEGYMDLRHI